MPTRLYRNTDGVLAIERGGIMVYGSQKAARGSDVTVEDRAENWVGLGNRVWIHPVTPELIAHLGSSRVESLIGGLAAVFNDPSTATEDSVQSSLRSFVPAKSSREAAKDRLVAWRDGVLPATRTEMVDLLTFLGI